MKLKSLPLIVFSLVCMLFLPGCNMVGDKTMNTSIIYFVTTILSLVMLSGYFFSIKKKNVWFIVLFVSVFVVNAGYFCLAVSDTLSMALWANRVSYLGSVFLPLSMTMVIMNVTKLHYSKWLTMGLIGISAVIFLIAASPGYLDIYYKSVTLENVNGVSVLIKEYGSWHCIYLFHLMGYFGIMAAIIIHAIVKKKIESTAHAIILIVSVLINILVWLLEQLVKIDFEFLSVSYIITEFFLISVYFMIESQENIIASLKQKIAQPPVTENKSDIRNSPDFACNCKFFEENIPSLTASERGIYDCYVAGMSTKEVLREKSITENTLKYHNRNIYGKLGVSSRKELLAYAKIINDKAKKEEENDSPQ